jgi:molecular chaperone GrpE
MDKKKEDKIDDEIKDNNPDTEVEVEFKKKTAKEDKAESDEAKTVEEVKEEEPECEEKTVDELIIEKEARINELEDRNLRLAAEFENFRKRSARQYQDIIKNANADIISRILEVVDNFERALEAAKDNSECEALLAGAEMINQQLVDILKKEGLNVIPAVGEPFDPNLHEAMMQTPSDEFDEGIIISEMTRGYKLHDKVLRFSKVVVSSGPTEKNDDKGDENAGDKKKK